MKSILRILIATVALLVVLVVALGGYLAFVFDPNDYREQLGELVFERTGRTLKLPGELKLSVFPWLGFKVGAAELGNMPGFSQRPLLALTSAEAHVKLMPLLKKEVVVDRVVLKGPQLSLERRADGRTNWEDPDGEAKGKNHGDPDEDASAEDVADDVPALVIGGVVIEDGVVVWDDAQAGVSHTLNDIDIEIGELASGKPVDFNAALSFVTIKPAREGRFSVSGKLALDMTTERYDVSGLIAQLKATGEVPDSALDATLTADMGMDLGRGTVNVKNLALKAYGVVLNGALTGSGVPASPHFKGDLVLEAFSPRDLMAQLGMQMPPTANADRLKHASAKVHVDASDKRIVLEPLVVILDDSTLSGQIEVTDLAEQALRFDITLDTLDVDSYLPPPASEGSGKVAETETTGDAAEVPPSVEGLRGLDVAGRLRVGALKMSGLQAHAIDVGGKIAGGRLTLTPKADLYEGKLDSRLSLDARPKTPLLAVSGGINDVQIGLLLRDLSGEAEKLTGRAQVSFDLKGAGLTAELLKRSLNGSVSLQALDGAVKGINIARYLREAQAKLSGKSVPEESEPNQTDFSDLSATLKLGDGIVSNDDLALRSPLLRVSGDGTADLLREVLDYRIRTSLVGTLTGQDGKTLDEVKEVTVPVKVTGSFNDPKIALDVDALLSGAAKEKIDAAREKAKDKIDEKLDKGLRKLLK